MSPNDEWIARRVRITGRVQGVGFRWSLREQARHSGVVGWVRNRRDGSVEALLCGTPQAVVRLIHWAGLGPPGAEVLAVEVEESRERAQSFERRPTE